MRFARLFRSRWAAIFWSLGVLWTAYDVSGGYQPAPARIAPEDNAAIDAVGAAVSNDDLAILANAMPGG